MLCKSTERVKPHNITNRAYYTIADTYLLCSKCRKQKPALEARQAKEFEKHTHLLGFPVYEVVANIFYEWEVGKLDTEHDEIILRRFNSQSRYHEFLRIDKQDFMTRYAILDFNASGLGIDPYSLSTEFNYM